MTGTTNRSVEVLILTKMRIQSQPNFQDSVVSSAVRTYEMAPHYIIRRKMIKRRSLFKEKLCQEYLIAIPDESNRISTLSQMIQFQQQLYFMHAPFTLRLYLQ